MAGMELERPGGTVVIPLTGEAIDLADANTDDLADAIDRIRDLESQLRAAKRQLADEAVARMDGALSFQSAPARVHWHAASIRATTSASSAASTRASTRPLTSAARVLVRSWRPSQVRRVTVVVSTATRCARAWCGNVGFATIALCGASAAERSPARSTTTGVGGAGTGAGMRATAALTRHPGS
jgi:hypothetical protein